MSENQPRKDVLPSAVVGQLTEPGLAELVRFLKNGKLAQLTEPQRSGIGDYHPVTIDGETYFSAGKNGKGVSATLAYAQRYGAEAIIHELQEIQAQLDLKTSPTETEES